VTLALSLLSACVAPGGSGGKGAMSFVGGDFHVVAPAGYCIDPAASHDSGDSAVVLIGDCGPVVPAIISITLGEPGSSAVLQSGARALSDYFTSRAGRAALARDGQAASVTVRETSLAGGALIMRLHDRQVGEYWRAVMGVKARLVSVSVTAPQTSSLSPDQSRKLLEQTMTALRAANGSAVKRAAP